MEKKDTYQPITDEQYESHFGLKSPENKDLHEEAFKKAWEIRNFEIDKFWQRSAFFWGFIALIFTGYFTLRTGKFCQTVKEMYLDFYLILLGIIFSVAWLLVICGNKRWQDSWEKHIERLEEGITGPLYRTLFYTGKSFYSVSKMNKILAWVVIATWGFLLIQYFYTKYNIIKNIFSLPDIFQVIFFILPLLGAIFCIVFMVIKGHTSGGELKVDLKKGEQGVFFIRD